VRNGEHDRYADDVAAYLVGALGELERQGFERHVMSCSLCRDELERLRPAAEALPHSVPAVDPPASLKASLMEVVEREAHEPRERRRAPGWRARLLDGLRSLSGARPALAAGVAAVLIAGVALGFLVGRAEKPGAERTIAARLDRSRVPSGSATLTVPRDRRMAILRVRGMPAPPRGRVYEVWIERKGRVLPASIFNVGRRGNGAAAVPDDVRGARAVLVTREPLGGSRAPTERPIVRVPL
jgi:anti-sigma-K factor RskA